MYSKSDKADRSSREDERLIRDFLAGNAGAFDRLVARHQDMAFNLCFRITGDYDEAHDCAQETFIKVYKNVERFRFQSSFTTWLYRIAVNTCRNRMSSSFGKQLKRMVRIDDNPGPGGHNLELHDSSFTPESLFVKNEDARLIHEAIGSLPSSLKELVVLRDLEGKSYEEISTITGINLGTVKSRLARARHLLRESLRGVW